MNYYKTHKISSGETLQSIANMELGATSYWTDLATLNDLEYPFIVETNEEKLSNPEHLKTLGEKINLTTSNSISNLVADNIGTRDRDKIYDITLGMDIALQVDSDSFMEEATSEVYADNGDLAVVVGGENLKQSLYMRIMTRKGSLLNHSTYGSRFPDYIGEMTSDSALQRAVTELKRTITTDTRVSSVDITTATIEDGYVYIVAEVTPIGFDATFDLFIVNSNDGKISLR